MPYITCDYEGKYDLYTTDDQLGEETCTEPAIHLITYYFDPSFLQAHGNPNLDDDVPDTATIATCERHLEGIEEDSGNGIVMCIVSKIESIRRW
jgi:hypothetical protein